MKDAVIPNEMIEDVVQALNMRICWLQTGDPHMNAVDADAYNRSLPDKVPAGSRRGVKQYEVNPAKRIPIKVLDREQRKKLGELEDLRDQLQGQR